MNNVISKHFTASIVVLTVAGSAMADGTFQLGRRGEKAESKAVVTASSLTITNNGKSYVYKRDKKLDRLDRNYNGYVNFKVRQAILWPKTDKGRMRIATIGLLGPGPFKPSRMEIRTAGGGKGGGKSGPIDPRYVYRLSCAAWTKPMSLGLGRRNTVAREATGKFESQYWQLIPVGKKYYRIINEGRGPSRSLSVNPRTSQPMLERSADFERQYWKLTKLKSGNYQITNYAMSNVALDSTLTMTKVRPAAAKSYAWACTRLHAAVGVGPGPGGIPGIGPGGVLPPLPTVRIIERKIIPYPPLKPVKTKLRNTHSKELWVLVHDFMNPTMPKRLKIPPRGSAEVLLERDSGAKLVITRELQVGGNIKRETITREIPPALLYDVSVYEYKITRIVINRIRKVPNMVTATPRSLGVFAIPPGPALREGTVIDAFGTAVSGRNPGAVRRLNPKAWGLAKPAAGDDDFERLLKRKS